MITKCICLLLSLLGIISPLGITESSSVPVWARFGKSDGVYARAETDEKVIALTFDDGPHPKRTKEILEILDEYGIKATFFFIGQNVRDYPDSVPLVQAAGHEIGNHTFSHRNLQTLDYSSLCAEIDDTAAAVEEMIGYRTKLLRPPEGKFTDDVLRVAEERGYSVICWSVDTLDWAHNPSENIAANILSSVEAGDIILFHNNGLHTAEALPEILRYLSDNGLRAVPISQMLIKGGSYVDSSGVQRAAK